MKRIFAVLIGAWISVYGASVSAVVLFDESYTGAELDALVPGTASYPAIDENTVVGPQLILSANQIYGVMYRLPIIAAGGLGGLTDLVVTITVDYEHITVDNDLGIAISDGARVLGAMQGDQTTNWALDSNDNGTNYGPDDFSPTASLAFSNPMTYVINASALVGGSSVTVSNGASASATHNGLGTGLDYGSQIDFLMVADHAEERHGVNHVSILATASVSTPASEPTTLVLLGISLLGAAAVRRKKARA